MIVYRIVKSKERTSDLSGIGAFKAGGRWNSKGTYMLYPSETSSLAYLETLVHFDVSLYPPHLYIMEIEIENSLSIYMLPGENYPPAWLRLALLENQAIGDRFMREKKFLGVNVTSAVNPLESYLLNPLYPRFYDYVIVKSVTEVPLDKRLMS